MSKRKQPTPKKLQPTTTVLFLDFKRKKKIGEIKLNYLGQVISKSGKSRSITGTKTKVRGIDNEPA